MGKVVKGVDEDVMSPGLPLVSPHPGRPSYPGFNPRQEIANGLLIDRDVALQLRDGKTIYADIFRREGTEEPLAAVLVWSAYGKHMRWWNLPGADIPIDTLSPHTVFECPDPVPLCENGYAYVAVDPRGVCMSEGDITVLTPQEGEDIYDTIEWIAAQPWCTGKVGMAGASYYGWSQWRGGSLRPPHLGALIIYDGLSDPYRELAFHAGIPNNKFVDPFSLTVAVTKNRREDWRKVGTVHPFFDDFWKAKVAPVEQIDVPLFVVSSWADHGIHTRGTLEAYKRAGTKQKWLEIHGRKKWMWMYRPETVQRQIAFFDRFLKGIPNEVDSWPAVQLEVREQANVGKFRIEQDWPLARTVYTPLYLNAADHTMCHQPVAKASQLSYEALATEISATFEYVFPNATEITGHSKLRLWVSAEGSDDMDLFVALQKVDTSGKVVNFPYFSMHNDGQVALGFLRVSHRELDETRSTPQQPILRHQREQRLSPGEVVPVDIELWPQSTRFSQGERLRVLIKGTDIQSYEPPRLAAGHSVLRNAGRHLVHTGGKYDSYLLLPVVPSEH
jgi:predicted acyl esterase